MVTVEGLLAQYQEWIVRVGAFVGTLAAVSLFGHVVVRPAIGRVIRVRNPNNETIVNAIEQYVTVLFVVVGFRSRPLPRGSAAWSPGPR